MSEVNRYEVWPVELMHESLNTPERTPGKETCLVVAAADYDRLEAQVGYLQRDKRGLQKQLDTEKERASFAWKNTREIDAERQKFRCALEKAADTFRDYHRALEILGKPLMAEGCKIAEQGCREALA